MVVASEPWLALAAADPVPEGAPEVDEGEPVLSLPEPEAVEDGEELSLLLLLPSGLGALVPQ